MSMKIKYHRQTVFKILEPNLLETTSEIKEVKETQEKSIGLILRSIQNLTLSVNYKRPVRLIVPQGKKADSAECPVLWQIATPEHWNQDAVEATLRNPQTKDEQFQKKFVRKGSLIMLTTISSSILSDPEAFEAAVIVFLTKMIQDCDVNIDIPGRIDVTIHNLNADEGCEKLPDKLTDETFVQKDDMHDEIEPNDLDQYAVQQSLEMGYTQEQVRHALSLLRNMKPGHHYFSINEILDALTKRTTRKTVTQND